MRDVSVDWVPKEEAENKDFLAQWYKSAVTVPGTRAFHAFEPVTRSEIAAVKTAFSVEQNRFRVFKN